MIGKHALDGTWRRYTARVQVGFDSITTQLMNIDLGSIIIKLFSLDAGARLEL